MERMNMKKSFRVGLISMLLLTLITSCNSDSTSEDSGNSSITDAVTSLFDDSAEVSGVKDAYVQACPTATLGEMADAFMSNPSWSDFTSTSGATIVELTGEITYDGLPANATIQFEISGGSFEATYLGIDGVDQNLFTLSTLLNKMCAAT